MGRKLVEDDGWFKSLSLISTTSSEVVEPSSL